MTQQKKDPQEMKNPGTLQEVSDKCTSIFPVFFDGFRIIIHRGLSRHFRVTHNIYFSSITPGNYRFGATYVGGKDISPHVAVPVLFGDIDSRGNMNASIYHLFGSRLKVRFDAQMENRSFTSNQLTTHYLGDTYTASAMLVNPDFMKNSGCLLLNYLQSVTPNLALGAELACLRNMTYHKMSPSTVPNAVDSQVSFVAKYKTAHAIWSMNVSLKNLLLCCYKKASEQIEFGLELNTNLRSNESVGSVAFQVTLQDRGIVFRGSVDTNTNVGSVFEKRICGSQLSFSVSSNLNHRTNNFRLGIGFVVE